VSGWFMSTITKLCLNLSMLCPVNCRVCLFLGTVYVVFCMLWCCYLGNRKGIWLITSASKPLGMAGSVGRQGTAQSILWMRRGFAQDKYDWRPRIKGKGLPQFYLESHQATTLGKLFTHVPLSPSSIIWYRPKCWEDNDSKWEGCGLPPT